MRGKHLGTHSFARRYYNFASTAFFTLLDRYSKITIGSPDAVADVASCFENFCLKFCRDLECEPYKASVSHPMLDSFLAQAGPRTLKLLGFIQSQADPDALNFHYFEYMKALQEKNLPSDNYQNEFGVFSMYIDFFSKKQAKPDVRHLFEERLKAGQGVSAFQKHVNALLAPYSRFLAECLHKVLLPNVFFASNRPDSLIGTYIAEAWSEYEEQNPNVILSNFACDFTEYDSSQYELSPYANSIFMFAMGAPVLLIDMYLTMRRDWILSDDMMKLYGHHKMHSGEPFTLVGNTLFGMLVIAESIVFDSLCYAVFKGDDSAVSAANVRFDNGAMQWCASRGLILKDEYPPHMEFAGMLITKHGFFPDVVRKCVKFLSTVFRDLTHYKSAVTNLDADLQCITSAQHIQDGCAMLSEFYRFQNKTNSINPAHVSMLLSFLYRQTLVRYDSLPDFDRDVLTYFTADRTSFVY